MGVPENVNFQIGVLLKDEAWSLFEKKVGDSIKADMRSVAEAVCEECACLPLVILAVGGALMKKSKREWKDALQQLRNSTAKNIPRWSTKVYSPIEFSYNNLEHADAKSIFLLCCLFGEDVEISIDNLVRYGVGLRLLQGVDTMEEARNRAHVLVTTLKTSSLLLDGSEKDLVKMHDVTRDFAIWIASKEEDTKFLVKDGVRFWPDEDEYKQCKAISLRFNNDCVLPNDLECSELHTLMLEFHNLSSEVPSNFFKGMEKLEVLQLRDMQISELPSSLKNLRMLCLYNCKLVKVAFLKEFKKLEILCIKDSDLRELAPEIGQLTRLRLLDLRDCDKLMIIPSGVISSLSQLEELYIPNEFDQWEVKDNASLNELNSLNHIISLQVFEPLFKSLNRFQISIGSKLSIWERPSSATRILKVVGFPLKKELNILMEKAEVLYLEDLRENVPKGLCGSVSFRELSLLKVENCKLMIYLFSSAAARSLSQLQKLSVRNCEIMEEIVRDDQEVMDEVIVFDHLKEIELKDLPNFRSFYVNMKKSTTRDCNTSTLVQALFNDKVAFPALEELKIENLKSLTAIWEGQSQSLIVKEAQVSFQSLRSMDVWNCDKLVNVIASNVLPSLQKLEKLKVSKCDSVKEIFAVERGQLGEKDGVHDEIIVFPQLKYLELEELPRVETLFNHKVAFPAPEELYIRELESLTAIWEGQSQSLLVKEAQVSFQSLRSLDVWECHKLVNVIASNVLPSLKKLEKLNVGSCASVEEIVAVKMGQLREEDVVHDEIIVFPQLKNLRLEDLPNLKSFTLGSKELEETVDQIIPRVEALFNHKVAFPVLEVLNIGRLESLTAIWEGQSQSLIVKEAQVSFQSLRSMDVWNCDKLVNVIASNAVYRCDSVEEIVAVERGQLGEEDVVHDEIIVFPQLKYLKLIGLPNLTSFTHESKEEGETMDQIIPRVEALFNHKVAFPALEELKIENLKSLTAIWEGQSQSLIVKEAQVSFQSLRSMDVWNCDKLVNVIASNAVYRCDSVEEIVAVERGQLGEEDVVHDEIIVFPQLKYLKLIGLPNLTSFTHESKEEGETMDQIIPRVEALFNHKVAFPALEELKIENLKSLAAIWEGQYQSLLVKEAQVSFQSLRFMTVWGCDKLVNVIASNEVYRCDSVDEIIVFNHKVSLPALEKLTIEKLQSLRAIWVDQSQPLEQVKEADDFFRCLTDMIVLRNKKLVNVIPSNMPLMLQNLKQLKVEECDSLFSEVEVLGTVEKGSPIAEPTINVLPRLQEMLLEGLPNLVMYIRLNRKEHFAGRICAYSNLIDLHLSNRDNLENVFSPSTARYLVHLQKLKIFNCEKMEQIVAIERGEVGENKVHDEIIVFPQLKYLRLEKLPNLKSLCCCSRGSKKGEEETVELNIPRVEALFNHKVAFPALEELEIRQLESLTAIWEGQSQSLQVKEAQISFQSLRSMKVWECHKLVNVIASNAVYRCDSVEEIVVVERGQLGKEDVMHDEIIVFPQLKYLELKELPRVETLFNHKVAFPALEELSIIELESLTSLWNDQSHSLLVNEGGDSFGVLKCIEVKRCNKLVNVIPSDVLPRLQNLEKLVVDGCDSLFSEVEVLGTVEKGSRIAEPTINVLPRLQEMLLEGLPNLVMYMRLNRKEHLAGRICAYSNLKDLHLSNRDNLENVFSPSTARYLVHLQKLKIFNCEKMEQIVAIERGELGEVEENKVHDEIIVFPQLKYLRLEKLPNLKSFCCCSRGSKKGEEETVELNIPRVEALFNHKVSLPALEELTIEDLESLTAIWVDQSQPLKQVKEAEDSFRRLTDMIVRKCEKLVNVIPSCMLPRLQNLKQLRVEKCDSLFSEVEVHGSVEKGSPTVEPTIDVLPRLQEMLLTDLPNLVMYMTLNRKEHFAGGICAYSNLTDLHLSKRDNLKNVFSPSTARYLVHLKKLEVCRCKKMEEIVAIERRELEEVGKEDLVHDEIIVFSQLKHLELKNLPNFKSFCCCTSGSKKREEETVELNISQVEALFNHKVAFPALEELEIIELESLTAIWEGQSQSLQVKEAQISFQSLRSMEVWECHKLVNVIASNVLPSLQKLEKLKVSECDSVKEIFAVERGQLGEKDGVHDEIIVFPQLKYLELEELPRVETLFNHKVAFPALEELEIIELESLTAIWEGQSQSLQVKEAQISFQSLRSMEVWECHKLVNVIASNVLPSLQKLEKLKVSECDSVKEIFAVERGQLGEKDGVHDEIIVFPQLKYLELEELPRVETLFNHKVAFPALEELGIIELKSLTSLWNDQSHSLLVNEGGDSFGVLKCIEVKRCNKLVNVIPSDVLPRLQNLEKLLVDGCDSVISEAKVLTVGKGSPAAGPTIVLPQLKVMCLMNPPYSMMYMLQDLNRKEYSGRHFAYPNLKELRFSKCHSLRNVFSPFTTKYLVHLEKLEVTDCEKMEEIVVVERGQLYREEDVVYDEIIVFPQLKHLTLQQLPNLNSFCSVCEFEKEEEIAEQNIGRVEALFNYKVSLPALEELTIEDLQSLTAIWVDQSQPLEQVKEAEDSFGRLTNMIVHGCEKLVNVIPSCMLPRLQNLKQLQVGKCDSLFSEVEVHGSVEKGSPTVEPTIDVLPGLQEMLLRDLPNLVMYMTLNRKEHFAGGICAYSNLTDLHLSKRDNLKNVFSPSTARYLVHLQKLKVCRCEKMEEIVAIERGKLEDLVHDEIIVFPQLKYLELENLPNLKSFCCCTSGSKKREEETVELNISQVEALFNHKVAFPALEELEIRELESLTAIWEGQSQSLLVKEAQVSFQSLRSMAVWECHKLVNVIASNVLPSLQKLEKLKVSECDSVEEIVAVERGQLEKEDIVHDEIIVFPQLKYLELNYLKNLKSFTLGSKESEETVDQIIPRVEALFNHKVAFPALEELEIRELESLTAIWEGQSQSLQVKEAQNSFQSLRSMKVWNCDKLVNVIASNVLPSLQKLEKLFVYRCYSVEGIVEVERGQLGEEDVVHDEIVVFSQLKYLKLYFLPNLTSFTHESKEEGETVDQIIPRVEALFNHKVAFPALEKLNIINLESLTAIWEGQSQSLQVKEAQISFQSLRSMRVCECHKLVNVIASNVLPSLQKLEKLEVSECDSVEEIVAVERGQLEKEDIVHDEIIVFPQLKYLKLKDLKNLKSFTLGSKEYEETVDQIIPRVEALFNHKVAFPVLEELDIGRLESLTAIWEGQSQSLIVKEAQVSFQSLRSMTVGGCEKLVNVIASNVLPSLQKLEKLKVSECDSVKEIFAVERGQLGEKDGVHDEITVFPQLKYLELEELPRVETLFNHKVSFPALKKLKITKLQSLAVIWDNQLFLDLRAQVSQLRFVIVQGCEKLVNVIPPNAFPTGLMVFHSLKYLILSKCNSLRYVFSFSIARGLKQLRTLWVVGCSVMEEIVRSEGEGEEDDMEEIVFSQLQELRLDYLKNLTCFCGTNNAFKFPSLEWVYLGKCPQLQTFTTGCLSTPNKLTIDYEVGEGNDVIDLNDYVQQFVRREKGLAVDESPGDDEDDDDLNDYVQQFVRREKGLAVDESEDYDEDYDFGDDDDDYDCDDDLDGFMLGMVRRMMYGRRRRRRRNKSW
ncbi:uncharacterized protein LOC132304111 isoform X4 [Cornus florida]|uniref:uncharacterized protein LOC132304111 isoform X4 n=1 Tax=Cornus florida TaxID=4283 RepID=UPI0028A04A7C|nr:uncharacterized protein LOC132304111 isoform X4 [Cornus florida]